jgi:hypothetical protein
LSSLSFLLGTLMTKLQSHHACQRASTIETKEFSSDQFFFKIRADFNGGNNFQARIYYNQGHIDYAYQLFTHVPLLRWDNKEEFENLETYPHHQHDDQGNVKSSSLTGNPVLDIDVVLNEISTFISGKVKVKKGKK